MTITVMGSVDSVWVFVSSVMFRWWCFLFFFVRCGRSVFGCVWRVLDFFFYVSLVCCVVWSLVRGIFYQGLASRSYFGFSRHFGEGLTEMTVWHGTDSFLASFFVSFLPLPYFYILNLFIPIDGGDGLLFVTA